MFQLPSCLTLALIGGLAFWPIVIPPVSAAEIGFRGTGGSCNFYIIGDIAENDGDVFRQTVLRAFDNGCSPHLLEVFSQGGNLQAAIDIGRQVSVLTMYTMAPEGGAFRAARGWGCNLKGRVVAPYDPVTKRGDRNCTCASACFFVWAAGVKRLGNVVIIHRPYFVVNIF
jgi:hypothetical protein